MNARILKKLSKRAMPLLIAAGFPRWQFSLAQCTEYGMAGRPEILKGTPVWCSGTSSECEEWDSKPAWYALHEMQAWHDVKIDAGGFVVDSNYSRRRRMFPRDVLRLAAERLRSKA